MSTRRSAPPEADEYNPFQAAYVALVREREPTAVLRRQVPALRSVCTGMTEGEALHRYAPGKWTIKELLGHLSDTERVLSYRLFRISRGDETPLSGFEENAYVDAGDFNRRSVRSLLGEFESVRAATLWIVNTMPPEAWTRRGVANGAPVSARALVFILAGHVEHHFEILRDRYALAVPHIEAPRA